MDTLSPRGSNDPQLAIDSLTSFNPTSHQWSMWRIRAPVELEGVDFEETPRSEISCYYRSLLLFGYVSRVISPALVLVHLGLLVFQPLELARHTSLYIEQGSISAEQISLLSKNLIRRKSQQCKLNVIFLETCFCKAVLFCAKQVFVFTGF